MNPHTPVLQVQGVGKAYVQHPNLFSRLLHWAGRPAPATSMYWANRDLSFSVQSGEALAIIGQNGAGKSTLLKMITGTTRPSTGSIHLHGRVSAMLELGLGFNPELTGRENALMAGGLLGHAPDIIQALIPEIEAFAEIGAFFDRPLRMYSSGMQARLAFAVATAVRPDVLIVDEILSVGDSYFQHRSFDRIRRFKEQGTAIILVTHGMDDVRSLCDRVLLLERGCLLKEGAPDEVVDYYNALIAQKEGQSSAVSQMRSSDGWLRTRSGTGHARVLDARLEDAASGAPLVTAQLGQMLRLRLQIGVNQPLAQLVVGLMLRDRQGHVIWGSNTFHTAQVAQHLEAGENCTLDYTFECRLGPGSYALTTALTAGQTHLEENYEWSDNLLVFDVFNAREPLFIGSQWLAGQFTLQRSAAGLVVEREHG